MNTPRKQPADRPVKKAAANKRVTPRRGPSPAENATLTSASEWKKTTGEGSPLVVPSGNTCLVRMVGMQTLLKNNKIPNSLSGIVNDAIQSRKPPTMSDLQDDLNRDQLVDIMDLIDSVTVDCVIRPVVRAVPYLTNDQGDYEFDDQGFPIEVPVSAREQGEWLYVDEIDLDDKMFIWQFAMGGTRDIESFRRGLGEYMGDVPTE